jgi:2'-5' RNA ligase
MRVFFAVNLPDSVKSSIEILHDPIRGVRWIPVSNIHLTLHFLGEQAKERVAEASEAAEKTTLGAFELQLSGTGVFPNTRRPSVLWAGVENDDCLLDLHERIAAPLRERGFTLEDRPFSPHVTVGRVRRGRHVDVMQWTARHAGFRSDRFRVSEFLLIASYLQPGGARYAPVASFSLNS